MQDTITNHYYYTTQQQQQQQQQWSFKSRSMPRRKTVIFEASVKAIVLRPEFSRPTPRPLAIEAKAKTTEKRKGGNL